MSPEHERGEWLLQILAEACNEGWDGNRDSKLAFGWLHALKDFSDEELRNSYTFQRINIGWKNQIFRLTETLLSQRNIPIPSEEEIFEMLCWGDLK